MGTSFNQRIVYMKDIQGRMSGGSRLSFFFSGSNIRAPIYYDKELTLAAPNDLIATAGGVFPQIFQDPLIEYQIDIVNGDNEVIDIITGIGQDQAVSDQIAENTADIGELNARADENQAEISVLRERSLVNFNEITVLRAEMVTAEADVLTLQGEVSTLQNDVTAINLDLDEVNESNHYMSFSLTGNTVNATRSPDVTVTNVVRSLAFGTEQIELTFSAPITFYYIATSPKYQSFNPQAGWLQTDFAKLGTSGTTLTLFMFDENNNTAQLDFSAQIFYKVA